jgi:hypothetical protein
MRLALCAVLALPACYAPKLVGGAPCEPARDSCPLGQSCVATGNGAFCMDDGTHRGIDAGGDAPPVIDGGGTCLGSGLLGSVCLTSPPTGPVTLSTTINTGSVAAATGCTEIRPQAGGPSLCIIAGTTIDIPATATVKAIGLLPNGATVTGTNPIVLFATKAITIEGTLNVWAHIGDTIGGALQLGAGARTATGCFVAGVDGQAGSQSFGGGGGAGGSFGGGGGTGGNGGNNNNTGRGNPAASAAPTVLVGGCPGGYGGGESGGAPVGGVGGNAGGAVYLLAGESITIAGKINASGSGGGGGGNGTNASGGGGGGGAGGLVGLEAGSITVTGAVFANGGGGGAGGGNNGGGSDVGGSGSDPSAATAAATGGSGSDNGGNGGAGAFGSTTPVAGKNGSGQFPQCAGGGGGGGTGVIRVFGVAPASLGGQISPPAR